MTERGGDRLYYAAGLAVLTVARPLAAAWRAAHRAHRRLSGRGRRR